MYSNRQTVKLLPLDFYKSRALKASHKPKLPIRFSFFLKKNVNLILNGSYDPDREGEGK